MSKATVAKHYIFVENGSLSTEAFRKVVNREKGLTDKEILETVDYVQIGDPKIPAENRLMLNKVFRKFSKSSKIKLLIAVWPDNVCCCLGCPTSNFKPDGQLLIKAYRESHHTKIVMRSNNSRLRGFV